MCYTAHSDAACSALPDEFSRRIVKPPGYVRGDRDTRAKRVIIFVHGVIGNGTSTWTNQSTGAYFPALVASDGAFASVDVWVHEFDTPKFRQSYTIDELADHLRRYLNNDNVITNHDEVIFVAHSMGGLIARAYLLKYQREVSPAKVRMLYFFSTPSTGSDVASLGSLLSKNPQLADMRKMTTDDAGVLGVWEAQWTSSPYAQGTLSYCAYELLPTFGTFVVQRESARHLCNTRPDPIARNHIDIVKPANNTTDESYVAFREAYRDTFDTVRTSRLVPAWNLTTEDLPLLRARNVTQTPFCELRCWSDVAVVAPGDIVQIGIYLRNTGDITARDTRLYLDVPQLPLSIAPINGRVSAVNTHPILGEIMIATLSPVVLVPINGWRYHGADETRQLSYFQQAGHAIQSEGIRLGDFSPGTDAEQIVLEFRCVPAGLSATEGSALETKVETLLKRLKDGPTEDDATFLVTPRGQLVSDELGQDAHWVSETHDIHDDGGVIAVLTHFNNTVEVQRDVRAAIEIVEESSSSATLSVTLRSATGPLRTETARLHFRSGTTQRLAVVEAFSMPKRGIQKLLVPELMANAMDDEYSMPLGTTAPNEIALGNVAPQAEMNVMLILEMTAGNRRIPFERRATTPGPTTLNADRAHPFVQVATDWNTSAWRTYDAGFEPGDPLGVLFYYRNTGDVVASDVRLRLELDDNDDLLLVKGALTAANAPTVNGEAGVKFSHRKSQVGFYYDNAIIYRETPGGGRLISTAAIPRNGVAVGDLDPGEWGWVKITYATTLSSPVRLQVCPTKVAAVGHLVDFGVVARNPTQATIPDVKLRVALEYSAEAVTATMILATREGELAKSVTRSLTPGERVLLRYRETTVYTSVAGRSIDARQATVSEVAIGNVPPNSQFFVRMLFDVIDPDARIPWFGDAAPAGAVNCRDFVLKRLREPPSNERCH